LAATPVSGSPNGLPSGSPSSPINSYSMPVAPGQTASSMPAYTPGAMPSPGAHANSTVGFPSPSTSLPPNGMPSATAGAMSAASPGGLATPNVPLPSAPGGFTPPGSASTAAATGSLPGGNVMPAASTEGYRPGTTARSTPYNFGSPSGATVPVSSNPYAGGQTVPLPTSTSSGSGSAGGYGSFQLPPNTATAPTQPAQPTYR
jgi:hypothetical protein